MRPPNPPPRRFLEKVLRWIPGTEIIADASLSHATDLYLAEHVFEGTTMFPGVMAIEAMVQAAMACAGREELPVLRNIVFRRPLIVPEDTTVVVRTLALAEAPVLAEGGDGLCVRVAMRSSGDDFQQNHFEAECWFDLPVPAPETLPACPPMPETLDIESGRFQPRAALPRKILPPHRSDSEAGNQPRKLDGRARARRRAIFQQGTPTSHRYPLAGGTGRLPAIRRRW